MRTKCTLLPVCLLGVILLALPAALQAQFTFTTNNSAITITGYAGGGAVVIPSTTNGFPVTSIGADAFDSSTMTSVSIPSSITNIGNFAFYYCYNLPSITIPGSVTSIGVELFEYCSSLTNVTFGNGVTSIGYS